MIIKNFLNLFKSPISIIFWIIFSVFFWILVDNLTNRRLIRWNFGFVWADINLFLDISNAVLIGIFVASFLYKYLKFSSIKNSWTWFFWWFLASIMTGCGSCSITLATYLGLSSIFLALPYWGLEIKIISTLILVYSVYVNLKNLETCKLKFRKK